jgi:hypothetical protein
LPRILDNIKKNLPDIDADFATGRACHDLLEVVKMSLDA